MNVAQALEPASTTLSSRLQRLSRRGDPRPILLTTLAIVTLRSTLLLWRGRVFAEEGTVYLQSAWKTNWLATMLAVHQGYYSLLMNAFAAVAARVLPLEGAAYLSVYLALAILLLTVYLSVSCEAFRGGPARWLAAAIIVFSPGVEIWLTLLDAQFYLVVCVALIAISSEKKLTGLRSAIVLLAGLTGPVSCALLPFFVYNAWRRGTRTAWLRVGILFSCAVLQGALLWSSVYGGKRTVAFGGKLPWFGPVVFLKVCAVTLATRLGGFLTQRLILLHPRIWTCVLLWLLLAACSAMFAWICRSNRKACALLAMSAASLAFNYAGDPAPLEMIVRGEFRYFSSGTTILWLGLLLACFSRSTRGGRERLGTCVLMLALFSGLADSAGYWTRLQRTDPRWSEQVAAWRSNPAYDLRVPPKDWAGRVHLTGP